MDHKSFYTLILFKPVQNKTTTSKKYTPKLTTKITPPNSSTITTQPVETWNYYKYQNSIYSLTTSNVTHIGVTVFDTRFDQGRTLTQRVSCTGGVVADVQGVCDHPRLMRAFLCTFAMRNANLVVLPPSLAIVLTPPLYATPGLLYL